jgi:di/tricarboxylate transporter
MVAFGALLLAVVLGLVPAEAAFPASAIPPSWWWRLVLVISAGLVRSGAVLLITRTLVDASRALGAHIAIMGGWGRALGLHEQCRGAGAPDAGRHRHRAQGGTQPGLSLMPLSFATILGGMVTLIGTPPNIIIATFREDALGEPFAMFDFAPVGLVAPVAGLLFVALIGWRLIPNRDTGWARTRWQNSNPTSPNCACPRAASSSTRGCGIWRPMRPRPMWP